MQYGLTLEELTKSLSGVGSNSGDYVSKSLLGKGNESRPLIDFSDFSNHIYFRICVTWGNNI